MPTLAHIFRQVEDDTVVGCETPGDFVEGLVAERKDNETDIAIERRKLLAGFNDGTGDPLMLYPTSGGR